MKIKQIHFYLFAILFFGTVFYSSDTVLDMTLVPRFVFGNSVLVLMYIVFRKEISTFLSSKIQLVDLLLFTYSIWTLLSITWSTNIGEALFESSKVWFLFTVYLLIKVLIKKNNYWFSYITTLCSVVGIIYSLVALIQMSRIFMDHGLGGNVIYLLHSPSGHKNLVSIYILASLPFHFLTLLKPNRLLKTLGIIGTTLSLISLFLLSSRSISVAFISMSLLTFFFSFTQKTNFKKGFLLGILLISISLGHWFFSKSFKEILPKETVTTKMNNKTDARKISPLGRSGNERLILWKQTLKLIYEEPILGVGIGNWKIEFPRNGYAGLFRAEFFNTPFNRPHNDFLWIWSELGIIGLLLFLGVLFMTFRLNWVIENPSNLILLIGLTGFLTSAFFDFPKERAEHTFLFAIYLALLTPSSKEIIHHKINPKIIWAFIFTFILTSTWFSWKRFQFEATYTKMRYAKFDNKHQKTLEYTQEMENDIYTIDYFNFPIKWYKGMSHYYLNDITKATPELESALLDNPTNFHSLNNLGLCYAKQNKFDDAINLFKEALKINQHFEEARFNAAFILVNQSKYKEAKQLLKHNIRNEEKRNVFLKEISLRENVD